MPCVALRQDDARDQEAGDDEEYVHANEAAGHCPWMGVVGDHQQDRDCPKTVDVRAVRLFVKGHGLRSVA